MALMPELGARAGVAVTARMDTTSPGTDAPQSRFDELLRLVGERSGVLSGQTPPTPVFVVVEAAGLRPRYTVSIGDGMSTLLVMAGAVAYMTNGCIRDIEGVRGVPFPCWAAGLSPMHGRLRWLDVGSPVIVDGMTVKTGDVVHADINGALVIPPGR